MATFERFVHVFDKRFIALAIVGLAACAPPQAKQAAIAPAAPKERPQAMAGYSLETPIEVIVADPRGAAVLNKNIPGLLTNPNYGMFKSMSLKQLASLSGGKLTAETLAQTNADLGAISVEAAARQ